MESQLSSSVPKSVSLGYVPLDDPEDFASLEAEGKNILSSGIGPRLRKLRSESSSILGVTSPLDLEEMEEHTQSLESRQLLYARARESHNKLYFSSSRKLKQRWPTITEGDTSSDTEGTPSQPKDHSKDAKQNADVSKPLLNRQVTFTPNIDKFSCTRSRQSSIIYDIVENSVLRTPLEIYTLLPLSDPKKQNSIKRKLYVFIVRLFILWPVFGWVSNILYHYITGNPMPRIVGFYIYSLTQEPAVIPTLFLVTFSALYSFWYAKVFLANEKAHLDNLTACVCESAIQTARFARSIRIQAKFMIFFPLIAGILDLVLNYGVMIYQQMPQSTEDWVKMSIDLFFFIIGIFFVFGTPAAMSSVFAIVCTLHVEGIRSYCYFLVFGNTKHNVSDSDSELAPAILDPDSVMEFAQQNLAITLSHELYNREKRRKSKLLDLHNGANDAQSRISHSTSGTSISTIAESNHAQSQDELIQDSGMFFERSSTPHVAQYQCSCSDSSKDGQHTNHENKQEQKKCRFCWKKSDPKQDAQKELERRQKILQQELFEKIVKLDERYSISEAIARHLVIRKTLDDSSRLLGKYISVTTLLAIASFISFFTAFFLLMEDITVGVWVRLFCCITAITPVMYALIKASQVSAAMRDLLTVVNTLPPRSQPGESAFLNTYFLTFIEGGRTGFTVFGVTITPQVLGRLSYVVFVGFSTLIQYAVKQWAERRAQ